MAARKTSTPEETQDNSAAQPESQAPTLPAEKPRTIRSICEEGLLAGLSHAEIIANVKAIHPAAVTTKGCISWYRSKLAKKGLVPSGKEMAEARKRAAEAERAKQ